MEMTRRSFMKSMLALGAAPAVIGSGILMPVRKILTPADDPLIGFIQSGTGRTVATAQERLSDWINVRDFGAIGDGITDDSAAISMAVQYAAASGKHVFLPAGIYRNARLPDQRMPDPIVRQAVIYGPPLVEIKHLG